MKMAPEVHSSSRNSSSSPVTDTEGSWRPLRANTPGLSTVSSGKVHYKNSCSSSSNAKLASKCSELAFYDTMGYRTGSNEDSAETSASCIAGSSFEWAFRDSNASTKQPEHHVRISAASLGAKQMSQCSSGLPSNSCSSSTRHVPSQDSGHAHHSTVPAFLTDARAFKEAVRALQGVPCADTDCEAPTSDLQQSPQAPHICLGASKTPKTLRSSDLMRRGPRLGGSCTDLRRSLHHQGSNTAQYDELDTFRLDLRRAQARPHSPSSTLETPRPHVHSAKGMPNKVSYLMSRHLADCDAMAATARTSQQFKSPCTPPQGSPDPDVPAPGTNDHPSPLKPGLVGCSHSINSKHNQLSRAERPHKSVACDEDGTTKLDAPKACSLSSDALESTYSGHPPFNSDGCPSKHIYDELLAALAEQGVHVRYVNETPQSRWEVTLTSTHDAQEAAACAVDASNDSGIWHGAQLSPHVSPKVNTGAASSESASTTVEGAACMQTISDSAADAKSDAPVSLDPADLSPPESCLPVVAASRYSHIHSSAYSYQHQRFMAEIHAKAGLDKLAHNVTPAGDCQEGSDENVLKHLTLARRTLDDYMFADEKEEPASSALGQHPNLYGSNDIEHTSAALSPDNSLLPAQSSVEQVTEATPAAHTLQRMCSTQESLEFQSRTQPRTADLGNSARDQTSNSAHTELNACELINCRIGEEVTLSADDSNKPAPSTVDAGFRIWPNHEVAACLPRASAADLAAAAAALHCAAQHKRITQHSVPWGAMKSQPLSRAADRCAATKLWVSGQETVPQVQCAQKFTNTPGHDNYQPSSIPSSEELAQTSSKSRTENEGPAIGNVAAADQCTVTVEINVIPGHPCSQQVSAKLHVDDPTSCCISRACDDSADAFMEHVNDTAQGSCDTRAKKEQPTAAHRGQMHCDDSNSVSTEKQAQIILRAKLDEDSEEKSADGTQEMLQVSTPTQGNGPNTGCTEQEIKNSIGQCHAPTAPPLADAATVNPEEDTSMVAVLCESLRSTMCELEAETVHRVQLQAEIKALQAAQQRQNAALDKLVKLHLLSEY